MHCFHRLIILRLEGQFHAVITACALALPKGRKQAESDATQKNSEENWKGMESCIAFFEGIQLLREEGVLDLETVDKMFGYWFFVAMRRILKQNLQRRSELLQKLHRDWKVFREQSGKAVP